MNIELLSLGFSVCLLSKDSRSYPSVHIFAHTDEECSLVCPSADAPSDCLKREDDWRALRVCGTLEFSLVGILAGISSTLAKQGISLFAVSTYLTDYLLVKQKDLDAAVRASAQPDMKLFDKIRKAVSGFPGTAFVLYA